MNKKILSVVLILCVMLAVMPMTAYAADRALCTKCNQVQTVRMTSQYADGKSSRVRLFQISSIIGCQFCSCIISGTRVPIRLPNC